MCDHRDQNKTKDQLIDELAAMRQKVAELEVGAAARIQELEELRERADYLNVQFEFAPDPYYLNDLKGVFVDGNRAAEELSGYRREELLGKSFLKLKLLPPKEIPKAARLLARNALGEPTGPDEFTLIRRDGRSVEVEISTFPVKVRNKVLVLGIARDVTDRKKTEKALRRSEERYARASAAGQVGVWEWDLKTNEMYVDPNLKALLGYEDHHIQNRLDDWGSYVHPADADRVMRAAEACIQGETPQYEVEHRMMHRNGGVRWLLARGSVDRDSDGQPVRMVGSDVDITYRKQAEDRLRSVTAQLVTAEEDERRRLSRELHDELNQKLALLLVDVESMAQTLPLPEEGLRKQLDEVKTRVGELSNEVHRLAYQLHPAVLDDLGLAAALRSYARELTARNDFAFVLRERNLPPELPWSVTTCLYRVGQEALRNAAKHSRSKRVTARLMGNDGAVVLSIRDYGTGFEPALAMKKRSGLGMSIMEERVRLLDGRISIRSTPGQGTWVRICIPVEKSIR
jgi:PAS domain S-box-containing protein